MRRTIIAITLLMTATVHAWPGHDWDTWKETTTWTIPDIDSPQVGDPDLVPLLTNDDGSKITTRQGWEKKRARTADIITQVLGSPNDENTRKPTPPARTLDVEIGAKEDLGSYTRTHLLMQSPYGDPIPAWLLMPKKPMATPTPAMVCVHQTVPQGKDEPVGIKGNPELAFALELVEQGYICIAPDMIGFGERIPKDSPPYADAIRFFRDHPRWSYMGRMIKDVGCAIDYLETLPEVDRKRIGTIGHSHGAYTSFFSAAYDPRIAATIASCGFTTFRADPKPDRWSRRTALIPQIGMYLPNVNNIPFDWHNVCSLIAPRPLFVWYGLKDDIFPNTDNLDALFQDVRNVYELYGKADDLSWQAFDGAHGFPPEARKHAYQWLKKQFNLN